MGHGYYREAHPLVFVISHYINLISMIALGFSGFYIHYPFIAWNMEAARSIHFFFMYLLLINLTARILMAFWVKDTNVPNTRKVDVDIKNWLPQAENRHQLVETVKFYLFMRKTHTISGKYATPQKVSYVGITLLTYVMAYTGFAIYSPAASLPFFAGGVDAVGGLMMMRTIHFFGLWVFIVFTMIHVYLATIHGLEPSKLMFGWVETEDAGH